MLRIPHSSPQVPRGAWPPAWVPGTSFLRGAFSREALVENSFFHGHRGEAGGESQAEDSSFGFLTFNGWLCQTAVLWEGSLPSAPTPGSDGDPEEYLQGQRPQVASQLPLF